MGDFEEIKQGAKVALPYTLELADPVSYGSKEIKELVFRNRLKIKDMGAMVIGEQPTLDQFIRPISKMTGELEAVIEELSPADYFAALAIVSPFLS
jgi:hypothetical protein